MTGEIWQYGLVFMASAVSALGLTPLAMRVAMRRGLLDRPGGHKAHNSPVPYLGGAAIVFAFSIAVLSAGVIWPPVSGGAELTVVLGIAVVLSLVGLVDDIRGLSSWTRLVFEVGAGVGIWQLAEGVQILDSSLLNGALTIIWIVAITNAFNLLDNMDGLSAGVAAIASAWFFVIAAVNGQFLVAALSIALAGCAVGFLRHNFHPARIYMGDAGSLFLGFLLAVIGIKLRFDGPTQVTFFVPVLIVGVAAFDTVLVVITRMLHGRSPMQGGRDHTSHRLVFVGLPVRVAVGLIYAAAVALGWLGLIMSQVSRGTGYLLMSLIVTLAVFVGLLLGATPVYATSRRRHLMIAEVERHERTLEGETDSETNIPNVRLTERAYGVARAHRL